MYLVRLGFAASQITHRSRYWIDQLGAQSLRAGLAEAASGTRREILSQLPPAVDVITPLTGLTSFASSARQCPNIADRVGEPGHYCGSPATSQSTPYGPTSSALNSRRGTRPGTASRDRRGSACLVTVSSYTVGEDFTGSAAVVTVFGDDAHPAIVRSDPLNSGISIASISTCSSGSST